MPRDVKWARPAETREDDDVSDLIFRDRPLHSRKKSPGGATSAFHKAPRGAARRRLSSRVACRVRILVREHVHPAAMSPVSLAPHRACRALAPNVGHAPANRRHRFLGRSTRTPRAVAPDVNVESGAVDPTSASDGDGFVLDSSGFALSLGENGYADADAAKLATRDVVAAGGHRDDASAVGAADDRAGDRAGGEAADRRDPSAGADGFRLGGGGVSDCRLGDAEGGHLERVLSRVGVTPCTDGDLGKDSRGRLSPCRAT